jgi:membrane protein implicated in regulation of membrane protease activity
VKEMPDFLANLPTVPVMTGLFIAAVALILIDYFFPVDFPAYLGYLCFAAGMFFALPLTFIPSLIAAVVIFVVLLIFHFTLFSQYLTNAQQDAARRNSPARYEEQ